MSTVSMKIKKVRGDKVEYYLDKDHSIVTGNGYLEAQGSQMWPTTSMPGSNR